MNLNKILVLLLCVFILLVITGCTYSVQPDSKENKQIGGCNNHYFTKFGIGVGDITVESIECEWTPNDRYGVVDSIFKTQIKDSSNNYYNIFYKKGCCHRHAYPGFTVCIISKNGETDLFNKMRSEVCSKLNNQFGDFTTQCENEKFEKKDGNSIIFSLKNDYVSRGVGSNIETVFVESSNCLDLT